MLNLIQHLSNVSDYGHRIKSGVTTVDNDKASDFIPKSSAGRREVGIASGCRFIPDTSETLIINPNALPTSQTIVSTTLTFFTLITT